MSDATQWTWGALVSTLRKPARVGLLVACVPACRPTPVGDSPPPKVEPTVQRHASRPLDVEPSLPASPSEPAPRTLREGDAVKVTPVRELLQLSSLHFTVEQSERQKLRVGDLRNTWLALDEHPPRRFESIPPTLARLLNEDEELAPGFHRLLAFKREETELLVQQEIISVETSPTGSLSAPGCVFFLPRGTYNGKLATSAIEVVVVPLRPGIDRIEVQAQVGDYVARGKVTPQTVVWIDDAPSGDMDLSVSCFSGQESLGTSLRRVVLNADTEPEEYP